MLFCVYFIEEHDIRSHILFASRASWRFLFLNNRISMIFEWI